MTGLTPSGTPLVRDAAQDPPDPEPLSRELQDALATLTAWADEWCSGVAQGHLSGPMWDDVTEEMWEIIQDDAPTDYADRAELGSLAEEQFERVRSWIFDKPKEERK